MTATGAVYLHLPQHMAALDPKDIPLFYKLLRAKLVQRGADVKIVARRKDTSLLNTRPQDFHFVHQGGVQAPRVLNCAVAYLNPYFYVDPAGIYFESTNSAAVFDPKDIPAHKAQPFFEGLVADHVTPRRSRHSQPEAVQDFPTGSIAVFLQDWSLPVERSRYMDAAEMVRTILSYSAGRPVVVKPHPRNQGPETIEVLEMLRAHPGVIFTDANLHDILARAAVSVSISSSVSVEGMLHRVPAILFGRSDLHHCAETVTCPADWPRALASALSKTWPFEEFLFWLLHRRSVNTGQGMMGPVLRRMAEAQADFGALGLQYP